MTGIEVFTIIVQIGAVIVSTALFTTAFIFWINKLFKEQNEKIDKLLKEHENKLNNLLTVQVEDLKVQINNLKVQIEDIVKNVPTLHFVYSLFNTITREIVGMKRRLEQPIQSFILWGKKEGIIKEANNTNHVENIDNLMKLTPEEFSKSIKNVLKRENENIYSNL